MEKEKIYKELSNSITRVFDANNIEILFTKAEIKDYKIKYSSVKKLTPTLFLDEVPISSIKKKIEYKCSCGRYNTILLYKFLKKERLRCNHCLEDEGKIRWHKLFFEMKKQGLERGNKERYKKTKYDFNNETDEFKIEYFKQHLTNEEFNQMKKYIYSVNDKIIFGKDVSFLIAEPSTNSRKYRQMIVVDGEKIALQRIKLKCPLCGKVFSISRVLKERVISHNFDCKGCYLNNKVFPIKKYRDNLTYQGKYELSFIKRCDETNIEIIDGAKIDYTFNNKVHTYTIDFYLPQYKYMVETKDNHIWHKKQVESGLWEEKEKAAKEYCKQNDMEYKLLFPSDIDNFFKSFKDIV